MKNRKTLFEAIKLEMETQRAFFDLCDNAKHGKLTSEFEISMNPDKCYLESYIATKDDGNELKKASYEIFCDNMNEQLNIYRKKFGFKFKVKAKTESGMLVAKVEIRRK